MGDFRTCCPPRHDVGLSSKESFVLLEQCWTDQWLCMRALPKYKWRRKFLVLMWKVQTQFSYDSLWECFSCQTICNFCFALYKGSSFPSTMTNIQFFGWHWTHMLMLTGMGHGLHMDLPWRCGFLDKGKGLLLVKDCSFQILLESSPPPPLSLCTLALHNLQAVVLRPLNQTLGVLDVWK